MWKKKDHNVSETGSASVLRWIGQDKPTPLGPLERTSLNHWTNPGPSQSQSYVTTDGQGASLPWNKVPILGIQTDLDYCLTVAGLLIWGALSDERRGLSFAIATGPRQRSHFWVRVPYASWPYFTVSTHVHWLSTQRKTNRRCGSDMWMTYFRSCLMVQKGYRTFLNTIMSLRPAF
jgi:hypothetical protein